MRRDYLKMNMLWAITRLVKKLYGDKLVDAEISYGNDEWGVPVIKMTTTVTKLNHRTGIIQITDKFVWGIKSIMYCFNLRPYKL